MSRSDASTFWTYSLNVAERLVRFVTVEPSSGNCVVILGAITFVGGMVIVTVTTAEVPDAPFASKAIAVSKLVPNGALQIAEYGAESSWPNPSPLARNCTLVTPLVPYAAAVTNKFVGPSMTAPLTGLVITASGVPAA